MSFNVSDVVDTFGSGGANVAPNQGVPNIRDLFRDLLGRLYAPVANAAALAATLAADRADGQQVITLDTYTRWTWKALDATAADAAHIAPTDVGAGVGRWVAHADESALSSGSSVLVNGVSAVIPANVTAQSRIIVSRSGAAASTALGELMAGNRIVGAPGSFKVTSEKTDMTGVQAGDQSTFDWTVIG